MLVCPRESVTPRQGDNMEGLFLSRSSWRFSRRWYIQRRTRSHKRPSKYYVDNTYIGNRPEVLHVSTGGDDTMQGVPNGKEGTAIYICV